MRSWIHARLEVLPSKWDRREKELRLYERKMMIVMYEEGCRDIRQVMSI